MAGQEKLIERILEQAREKANTNIENAQKQAENIIEAVRKEAMARKEELLLKAKNEGQESKKRLIAAEQLEIRKNKLKVKQEIIQEVFSKAMKKLNSLSLEEYSELLSEMVMNTIKSGDEEVILSDNDKARLGEGFIKKVNKKLSKADLKGNLKLSDETRNISGGFILKQGNIETNNSFETLFRVNRDNLEADVVRILFDA